MAVKFKIDSVGVNRQMINKTVFFSLKLIVLSGLLIFGLVDGRSMPYDDYDYGCTELSEETPVCLKDDHNRTCCYENEFQCGNGRCIPQEKVCDSLEFNRSYAHVSMFDLRFRWIINRAECTDGTDEVGCLGIPCSARNISKCPHTCIDLPGNKSRCTCYSGYTLRMRSSKPQCEDVDECQIGVHLCSHDCINLNGTFACDCKQGFQNDSTSYSGACKAEDRNLLIFYNSHNWIYSYNVETKVRRALVRGGSNVSSITYDPITDILYWSNEGNIFRSFIPGSRGRNITVGFPQPLGMSSYRDEMIGHSLAIDWTAGNIYWLVSDILNNSYSQIMVSKLDGRYIKTMNEVPKATSLVLDPEFGRMYWASAGDEPYIGGAWMNGLFRWNVVRLPQNHNPTVLTLDHLSAGRLYWADSNNHSIYYVYKDGTRPTKIIDTTPEQSPFSLDVFENYLYWVTALSEELVRMDKFGRGKIEVLPSFLDGPSVLRVYHPRRVEVNIRPGSLNCSNQCSHLCLHIPRGYACTCPDGNKLISIRGEIVCDNEEEEPMEDPLSCNCDDKPAVCNTSSPLRHCPCYNVHCDDGLGEFGLDDYQDKLFSDSGFPIMSTVFGIAILLTALACALSFFKKSETR